MNTVKTFGNRQGVAIILVLGMMGIFLISATAFSIAMRVERRASSNYRYTVQSRHLLWAALSTAIDDISASMTNTEVYPAWAVLASGGDSNSPASLISKAGSSFVPVDLQTHVDTAQPLWRLLRGGGGTGTVWGRYAFLALNTSGYLDANVVGGTNLRMHGSSPAEIRIDKLPEVQNAGNFRDARDSYYRYETLAEFSSLRPGIVGNPESFSVYSLSGMGDARPPGGGALTPQINLSGDYTTWDQSQVSNALVNAGIPSDISPNGVVLMYNPPVSRRTPREVKVSNLSLALANLRDFVDSDSVPQVFPVFFATNGSPQVDQVVLGTEAVPMLSEVIATYAASYSAGYFVTSGVSLQLEWHFPFVKSSPLQFDLQYFVTTKALPANTHAQAVPVSFTGTRQNVTAGEVTRQYGVVTLPRINPSFQTSPTGGPFRINFEMEVKTRIRLRTGMSDVVDEVPSPWVATPIKLTIDLSVNAGQQASFVDWMECLDPRFNHCTDRIVGYWARRVDLPPTFNPTPGVINNVTLTRFDNLTYDMDRDTDMYVSNRPLRTIGELGHICYDTWRTIRLYKHDKDPAHPVIDYFTLSTNKYRRGLVNINTTNENILASVFYYAPFNELEDFPSRTGWDTAVQLAQVISINRPYERVTDAFSSTNLVPIFKSCGSTEIEHESVIRNSMDLFTVRQNLFTIFLGAESFSESIGGFSRWSGNTLSRARAVAEVWRDPFVDTNGMSKCFVRYFKILDD